MNQPDADTWHTVNIDGVFNKPVVIMGPLSFNGAHPSTIRIKEVSRKSFKWQMQEWSYLDQSHTTETVSYLVVEAGAHELPGGTWIEAGKSYSTSQFKKVAF